MDYESRGPGVLFFASDTPDVPETSLPPYEDPIVVDPDAAVQSVQCLVLGNYLRAVTWDSTGIPPSIGASHGTVVGVDTVQPRPFCVGAVDEVLADGGMNNAVVPDHAITGAHDAIFGNPRILNALLTRRLELTQKPPIVLEE
jgi:hypothetical protein